MYVGMECWLIQVVGTGCKSLTDCACELTTLSFGPQMGDNKHEAYASVLLHPHVCATFAYIKHRPQHHCVHTTPLIRYPAPLACFSGTSNPPMDDEPLLDEQGVALEPGKSFFWAVTMDQDTEAIEPKDPEHV